MTNHELCPEIRIIRSFTILLRLSYFSEYSVLTDYSKFSKLLNLAQSGSIWLSLDQSWSVLVNLAKSCEILPRNLALSCQTLVLLFLAISCQHHLT